MKRITGRAVIVVCSLMLLQYVSFAVQGERGAKALFYDPETGSAIPASDRKQDPKTRIARVRRVQPAQVRYAGLHYWIELDGVGPVTTDRVFRNGDRIRVHIRSNVDGYLSLWSLDASGAGKLLFPGPGSGSNNYLTADTDHSFGTIKFAPPAEDERMIVHFSRTRTSLPDSYGKSATADIVAQARTAAGSKALVFETENKEPSEVGHYVVSTDGGAVIKEVLLRHR
jgi:Domain of unknown function (DUF4384)